MPEKSDKLSDSSSKGPSVKCAIMTFSVVAALVSVATFLYMEEVAARPQFFTAAVFEHHRFGSRNDSPAVIIDTNLKYYAKAAEIAKSKGADVIVFPEYGIILAGSRQQLKPFLETVPNPNKARVNPCDQPELYLQRPILHRLSCIAKNNAMFVVGNMGDIQDCAGQSACPSDGVFHYNTNVVFDRNGTLLVRYHKEHLFFERGMDLPTAKQTPVFKTDFGTFATFICFDSMFGRMSEVSRWNDVEGVMFPTKWVDGPPQLISVQYWEALALGNGVPLLAANGQAPGESAVGSGVFHGQYGALAYTFNPDGISKLVVSTVPKKGARGIPVKSSITAITDTKTWDFKDDGRDVPNACSDKVLPTKRSAYRCQNEKMDNYTMVKLTKPDGYVEVCNSGMCCSLNYTTDGMDETFYLAVYNSTHTVFNRYSWYEENCVLTRCKAEKNVPCSTFPLRSETVFQHVQLKANFTTDFVFPSITSSGVRLVPRSEWQHRPLGNSEVLIDFENISGRKLTSVGLKGRCFDKDPPFKAALDETPPVVL